MKKSFHLLALALIAGLAIGHFAPDAASRITGYLYGDSLIIGYPGTTVASISTAGAGTFTGLTNTGALANTGTFTNTGALSATSLTATAGSVTISSSAATAYDCAYLGAQAALPTTAVECSQVYLISDHKLYVATVTVSVAANGCLAGGCWAAVH